jgi:hypothetical protein
MEKSFTPIEGSAFDPVIELMDERSSPTGEPHRDPIESEPWKIDEWARELGITKQELRQLAAQVGPEFEKIQSALRERLERQATQGSSESSSKPG